MKEKFCLVGRSKGLVRISVKGLPAFSVIPECLRTADAAREADLECIGKSIEFYTKTLLGVVALGAFLFLLYGAFQYITAFGDDSKAGQAKKTILSGVMGIIIALLAYAIIEILKLILGA